MVQECFDAHLLVSQAAVDIRPSGLLGAVLYGPNAAEAASNLKDAAGEQLWRHAEPLAHVVGRADSRFPTTLPVLIDLQVPEDQLCPRLKTPLAAWYPLAEACRESCVLKLNLASGPSAIAGPKKLIKTYPHTRFLVDAFRHGPVPGWQAHVRLAECENAWLTTLGLFPGQACRWLRAEDVAATLHFVLGEVGASKLLFASGQRWEDYGAVTPAAWLSSVNMLNDPERDLIGLANAREIFV